MPDDLIPLDAQLGRRIPREAAAQKKASVEVAALAAEVRSQHLAKKGGKYDAAFAEWWKANDMNSVFGTLSTFTTYAKAGDAVGRFMTEFESHADQMPT